MAQKRSPGHGGCRGFGFRLGGTTTGEGSPRLCIDFITPGRAEKLQISQLRGFSVADLTMARSELQPSILLWIAITARYLPSLGGLIFEPNSGERERSCLRARLFLFWPPSTAPATSPRSQQSAALLRRSAPRDAGLFGRSASIYVDEGLAGCVDHLEATRYLPDRRRWETAWCHGSLPHWLPSPGSCAKLVSGPG